MEQRYKHTKSTVWGLIRWKRPWNSIVSYSGLGSKRLSLALPKIIGQRFALSEQRVLFVSLNSLSIFSSRLKAAITKSVVVLKYGGVFISTGGWIWAGGIARTSSTTSRLFYLYFLHSLDLLFFLRLRTGDAYVTSASRRGKNAAATPSCISARRIESSSAL